MYNLVCDNEFKNNWKLTNCQIKNNLLISDSKYFTLSQKILINKKSKVYFRVKFKALSELKDFKIGLKVEDTLYISSRYPKLNDERIVSIIEEVQGLIELFIIIESYNRNNNKILINEPFLLNLNNNKLEYNIKEELDLLKYRKGLTYHNLLGIQANYGSNSKYGSYIETDKTCEFDIKEPLILNKNYVFKLRIEELNKFGNIYLTYGLQRSNLFNNDLILAFKNTEKYKPKILIEKNNDYNFNYKVLLKEQLLAQIDNIDIEYIKSLEFIG